jgi:hypothetical protein
MILGVLAGEQLLNAAECTVQTQFSFPCVTMCVSWPDKLQVVRCAPYNFCSAQQVGFSTTVKQ